MVMLLRKRIVISLRSLHPKLSLFYQVEVFDHHNPVKYLFPILLPHGQNSGNLWYSGHP